VDLTQFSPLYHQNNDHAYQKVINRGAALLSQMNINDLLLKTDGTPMNLNIFNQHISAVRVNLEFVIKITYLFQPLLLI